MPVIRTTKTSSGKTAVQVVERFAQQTKIVKHIGSATTEQELTLLKQEAEQYRFVTANMEPLFPELFPALPIKEPEKIGKDNADLAFVEAVVDRLCFTNTLHTFAYEFLALFYERNGFTSLQNALVKDLVIMRLIEPCSKLRSIELLQEYFGISYTRDCVYEWLPKISLIKEEVETIAVAYAKKHLGFDFSLVFYDVTTLYFETFRKDQDEAEKKEIRKETITKEGKTTDTQNDAGYCVTRGTTKDTGEKKEQEEEKEQEGTLAQKSQHQHEEQGERQQAEKGEKEKQEEKQPDSNRTIKIDNKSAGKNYQCKNQQAPVEQKQHKPLEEPVEQPVEQNILAQKETEKKSAKLLQQQMREEQMFAGERDTGFSKDNKPQQPQIVIGLLVNKDGYPIAIEIFSGNTFEGHTMIPLIKKLQAKYGITTLTIVADAGMLSQDNIDAIKKAKLHYIVGARLGNANLSLLKEISENLNKKENSYYTTKTDNGLLICDYSKKRATKDSSDRKKQLKKAQYHIDHPEKTHRKTRFVQEATKDKTKPILTLNEQLIKKDKLKEGIKGYYTNLIPDDKVSINDIVSRYKDLWHVEKSFRITKSDLEARPIFHRKKESIRAHIIIVFISLCLAKSIEMYTTCSIKKVRDMIWKIQDIWFTDPKTGKQFCKRMEIAENPMAAVVEKVTREMDQQKQDGKTTTY